MNDSILSLTVISVIFTLITHITDSFKFKKAIKAVCGFLVIASLFNALLPILSLFKFDNLDHGTSSPSIETSEYSELLTQEAGHKICVFTKEMLCKKFGLPPDSIYVSATLTTDGQSTTELKMITVKILKPIDCDENLIAQIVSDTLLCKCTVLLSY